MYLNFFISGKEVTHCYFTKYRLDSDKDFHYLLFDERNEETEAFNFLEQWKINLYKRDEYFNVLINFKGKVFSFKIDF